MISDDLKKSIDRIWDTLWAGGLTNPLTDVEQITYLLFMKLIDDNETRAEKNAAILGGDVIDPIFKKGVWKPEGAANGVAYDSLRWKNFCHKSPDKMLSLVREYVFPFIKTLGKGKDTAFSAFMADAVFLIPTANVLVTLVDEISAMDLNNKDAMGDVYEELLNRVASSGTNGQFRTPRHITDARRHGHGSCDGVGRIPSLGHLLRQEALSPAAQEGGDAQALQVVLRQRV